MNDPNVTVRFTAEMGVFVRNAYKAKLRFAAKAHGVQLSLDEEKGFFSSVALIELVGKQSNVAGVLHDMAHPLAHKIASATESFRIKGLLTAGD